MTVSRRVELAEECEVFCRYLIGAAAPGDVVEAYVRAHQTGSVRPGGSDALERALISVARFGPAWARAADAYAAVFARSSALRRKIVLVVAILESRGQTAAAIDTAVPGSRLAWILELACHAGLAAARIAVAAVVLAPLRLWYRLPVLPVASEGGQPSPR